MRRAHTTGGVVPPPFPHLMPAYVWRLPAGYCVYQGAFDTLAAVNTRKGRTAADKLEKYQGLWDAAQAAMMSVDPEFASKYTSCAFTHCFEGSPHIDKQNLGPFYGIALGDFPDGTGGIRVECSARVVAEVNTKNRLGKVDGRNPHWVTPYDKKNYERFSVIYYITKGEPASIGPAIFSLPSIIPLKNM